MGYSIFADDRGADLWFSYMGSFDLLAYIAYTARLYSYNAIVQAVWEDLWDLWAYELSEDEIDDLAFALADYLFEQVDWLGDADC